MKAFNQGYLDSLCGVYSIVNAEKLINNSPSNESQKLFNEIIAYLSRKRILKKVIIDGVIHRQVSSIMSNVVGDKIPLQVTNKKGIWSLDDWWNEARGFLSVDKRAILLSLGGIDSHLTTVYKVSEKNLFLLDSNAGDCKIHRNDIEIVGNAYNDKHLIYPAQCWYLGKE